MSDGKVMQKYYPPDFDPEKLKANRSILRVAERRRGGGRKRGRSLMEIRMMYPFTLCCDSCKDFILVGTKFNSRVEKLQDESYLGIPIWRFYARCPHCHNEIRFKTDPKNTDYVLETGGVRTSDPQRDASLARAALMEEKEKELAGDSIRILEHKSSSAAEELRTLQALDDLRRLNRRLMASSFETADGILKVIQQEVKDDDDEDIEEELQELQTARKIIRENEELEQPPARPTTKRPTQVKDKTPKFFRLGRAQEHEPVEVQAGAGLVSGFYDSDSDIDDRRHGPLETAEKGPSDVA